MIGARAEVDDARLDSPLGRVSPVVKLAIAILWLAGLAVTLRILPPLILAAVALVAGIVLGRIPARTFARSLAPLWIAAIGIGISNTLFAASNGDPAAAELVRIGPIRITVDAAVGGIGLVCRVVAIASVGAVFALTTDSDAPRRLAGPAGARLAPVRLRSARRLPGDPPVRRGPDHASPGSPRSRTARQLASRVADRRAGPRHPSCRPDGARHGRPCVRLGAADVLPSDPLELARPRGRGGRGGGAHRGACPRAVESSRA